MQTRYINTASAGGDGTTNNTSGATAAWASLDAALVALEDIGALADAYTIYCSGSTADSVERTINVDIGTSAANYVLFTTQGAQRHAGVWDTGIYRLSLTNQDSPLYLNAANHVRIDGLQLEVTSTAADEWILVKLSNASQAGDGKDLRLCNCILKSNSPSTGTTVAVECRPFASGTGEVYVYNNIVYGFTYGLRGEAGPPTAKFYNNTVYGCTYNYFPNSANGCICVNCLSAAPVTDGFSTTGGTYAAGTKNNASSAADAPGTDSRNSQSFTFVDPTATPRNLHLQSGDGGAKDFGFSDPGSGLFSTDIDSETRSGSWDIGADEYVAAAVIGGVLNVHVRKAL